MFSHIYMDLELSREEIAESLERAFEQIYGISCNAVLEEEWLCNNLPLVTLHGKELAIAESMIKTRHGIGDRFEATNIYIRAQCIFNAKHFDDKELRVLLEASQQLLSIHFMVEPRLHVLHESAIQSIAQLSELIGKFEQAWDCYLIYLCREIVEMRHAFNNGTAVWSPSLQRYTRPLECGFVCSSLAEMARIERKLGNHTNSIELLKVIASLRPFTSAHDSSCDLSGPLCAARKLARLANPTALESRGSSPASPVPARFYASCTSCSYKVS